jgi:hypothetical protein
MKERLTPRYNADPLEKVFVPLLLTYESRLRWRGSSIDF